MASASATPSRVAASSASSAARWRSRLASPSRKRFAGQRGRRLRRFGRGDQGQRRGAGALGLGLDVGQGGGKRLAKLDRKRRTAHSAISCVRSISAPDSVPPWSSSPRSACATSRRLAKRLADPAALRVAGLAERRDLRLDLAELRRQPFGQPGARLILAREMAGERFDRAARLVSRADHASGRLRRSGALERGAALLDHRQHRLALRVQAGARLLDRFGGATHRAIDGDVHRRRRLVDPLGRRSGAGLEPRNLRAEPLRRAAQRLVRLASARGERREMAFQRRRLLVRGEAGGANRLGRGARLRFRLGQIAEQHAEIDPGAGRRGVERLRGAVQRRRFRRRARGSSRPIRSVASSPRLISRLASSRQSGAIFVQPRRDDRERLLERLALAAQRAHRRGEPLGLAARRAAEQQPDQSEQDQRRARSSPAAPARRRAQRRARPVHSA